MGEERDTFRQLEQANRRKTVELVAVFVLIYAVCGFGLDLIFHTFRVINHQLIGSPVLMIAAVAIASAQALWAWYRGSSIVIGAVQADDLTPASVKEQTVIDVVTELALAVRMPMPRVCLMEDPAPNAFAAGRDSEHSVICVTRGLVDQLEREELQGVIAHELAHIRGHDTRVTQMAVVMVGGFALLSGSGFRMAAAIRRAAIPFIGVVIIPIFILGIIGWIFSKMVAIALSRQREYLADAAAVEFTRNPTALIRALEHIARIESPLKASLRGVAPLFIVDPFECGGSGWTDYLDEVTRIEAQQELSKEQRDAQVAAFVAKGMPQISFQSGFSSHQPLHDRIARLRALLHEPSSAPEESPAEIVAKRKAAAKAVAETTKNNPEVAAAMMASMIQGNPLAQVLRAFGENSPASELVTAQPSEVRAQPSEHDHNQNQTYADPSEQATYQKLYEFNLGLTGDKARSHAVPASASESPLDALRALTTMDPAQLQATLAAAMAGGMHKESAASPASVPGGPRPSKNPSLLVWLVIAVSVGAIIASFAIK